MIDLASLCSGVLNQVSRTYCVFVMFRRWVGVLRCSLIFRSILIGFYACVLALSLIIIAH